MDEHPSETEMAALRQLLLEAREENFLLRQKSTELEEQLEKVLFRLEKFKVDNERLRLQNDYLKSEVVENHQDFLGKLLSRPDGSVKPPGGNSKSSSEQDSRQAPDPASP